MRRTTRGRAQPSNTTSQRLFSILATLIFGLSVGVRGYRGLKKGLERKPSRRYWDAIFRTGCNYRQSAAPELRALAVWGSILTLRLGMSRVAAFSRR